MTAHAVFFEIKKITLGHCILFQTFSEDSQTQITPGDHSTISPEKKLHPLNMRKRFLRGPQRKNTRKWVMPTRIPLPTRPHTLK